MTNRIKIPMICSMAMLSLLTSASSIKKAKSFVLPEKKVLPITLESFCAGIPNVTAITKQDISEEVGVFCNESNTPTTILTQLINNPYQGTGAAEDFIITLPETADINNDFIQLNIAYSIKVKRKAVAALLAEEPNALLPYETPEEDDAQMKIDTKFLATPENKGGADTSFMVEQIVNVNREERLAFKDVSQHRLNMYRVHKDNLDFFMAARTLESSKTLELTEGDNDPVENDGSKQFEKSNVVRGIMTAPNDPESSIIFSTINIIMNSRGGGNVAEGMEDAFELFLNRSLIDAYQAHQK